MQDGDAEYYDVKYKDIDELPLRDRLIQEKDSTGFYFPVIRLTDFVWTWTEALRKSCRLSESVFFRRRAERTERRLRFLTKIRPQKGICDVRRNCNTYKREGHFTRWEKWLFITLEMEPLRPMRLFSFALRRNKRSYIYVNLPVLVHGAYRFRNSGDRQELNIIADALRPLRTDEAVKANPQIGGGFGAGASGRSSEQNNSGSRTDNNLSAAPGRSSGASSRLYLRVADKKCRQYLKVMNLISIFSADGIPAGGVPVYVYDASDKSYTRCEGAG